MTVKIVSLPNRLYHAASSCMLWYGSVFFPFLAARCLLFFFFSSRRRHTRCSRDWSSDVCSSDLLGHDRADRHAAAEPLGREQHIRLDPLMLARPHFAGPSDAALYLVAHEQDEIGRASCRERV